MALAGPISGRLSDRYGTRWFTVGGLALSTTALFLFSRLTGSSPLYYVMVGIVLQNMGMGVFYSPNTSSVLSTVERSRYGVVSAFLNLVRNASNLTSVALGTAIVTATMGSLGYEPSLDAVSNGAADGVTAAFSSGLHNAFLVLGCLLAIGMALSSLTSERLPGRAGRVRSEA
jgi:MFS family permease